MQLTFKLDKKGDSYFLHLMELLMEHTEMTSIIIFYGKKIHLPILKQELVVIPQLKTDSKKNYTSPKIYY